MQKHTLVNENLTNDVLEDGTLVKTIKKEEEQPTLLAQENTNLNTDNAQPSGLNGDVMQLDEPKESLNTINGDEKSTDLDPVGKLEKSYYEFTEILFNEKLELLKKEYENIKDGNNDLFLKKTSEIKELKEQKLWAAEKWKELQMVNLGHLFESEVIQAEEEFKIDKKGLREKMLTNAIDKKRKLIEEKNTINLSEGAAERIMTRTLRSNKRSKDNTNNYKRRVNPPHIIYTLKDQEIMEDLNNILVLNNSNTINNNNNNNNSLTSTINYSNISAINTSNIQNNINTTIPINNNNNNNNNNSGLQSPNSNSYSSNNNNNNNSPPNKNTTTSTTTNNGVNNNNSNNNTINNNSSSSGNSDVYADKGKLHYHGQVIDKGADVTVESKVEGGRWQGIIIVVNPAEIHIKSPDGTKSRFSLSQLRNGKYSLSITV